MQKEDVELMVNSGLLRLADEYDIDLEAVLESSLKAILASETEKVLRDEENREEN